MARDGGTRRAAWDRLGSLTQARAAGEDHLEAILGLPLIDVGAIRQRNFRVAADCIRGAAGPLLSGLLQELGCEVTGIGMEADGRFTRDPEPTPGNLGELCDLVRSASADIGLAIDPDGDRLALADEQGMLPGEDATLALAATAVLRRERGPVVANLSTSQVVEDVARAYSVPFHRASVGEINVAVRMSQVGAVVGGEGNGGVILPALHSTRDAFVGVVLVLQHLVDIGGPLSRAISNWPAYAIIKRKAALPRRPIAKVLADIERSLVPESTDTSDGLRVAWPSRREWLHVRPSGTEPVLRVIAEAPRPESAKELVDRAVRATGLR